MKLVSGPIPKRLEKQLKKQAKKEAKKEGEHTATENNNTAKDLSFIYRVKLDVTVNAPIIILPTSNQAVLLDCGLITVKTNQEILTDYYRNMPEQTTKASELVSERLRLPPLLEVQRICLSDMIVSRAHLERDLSVHSEVVLVDCSDLNLQVRRSCFFFLTFVE